MRKFISILIVLISPVSFSAVELPVQTIKQFSTGWGAEGFYIWTNENEIGDGCTSGVLRLEPNHPLKSEMVSMLLSAYYSGSKVQFYVDGCMGAQMKLQALRLLK